MGGFKTGSLDPLNQRTISESTGWAEAKRRLFRVTGFSRALEAVFVSGQGCTRGPDTRNGSFIVALRSEHPLLW